MKTYLVDIINPKALKLLQDLADLNLIVFKPTEDSLDNAIKRIRKKAAQNPPSQEEIIREVEIVREKRYGRKKG
jgi:hypothetical protein